MQFQQGHAQGQFGILGEVSYSWKCLWTKRQDLWHSTPTTPTYYKASRMLNHHTHLADTIRDKKTNAVDISMASPSRQHNFTVTMHNFTVRVSHKCIVTVAEFGRSRQGRRWWIRSRVFRVWALRVWALPPSTTLDSCLRDFEFGCSRHQRRWDSFVLGDTIMDNGYIYYTYI